MPFEIRAKQLSPPSKTRTLRRSAPSKNALGRDISLSCIEPGSRPREIGAGLLYSLPKSVVLANNLCLNRSLDAQSLRLSTPFL